ncbi:MAG: protoporphyrinogen oxidase [Limimaricola sp.]|uniref:flavodoxin domain-containing protein n=1 Tax=Limimaricola sp. TaxID=2211665 RepID=UPI001DA8F221|nr:flavodoxin domain-containing protein [Limimaricola sp.]MBI1418538.1 protoporphyrinogen oxidase [Limimaricola sp.]
MKNIVIYATTDGQTRKIARFCADRLADLGDTVELLPAAETDDLDLTRFDAAILAGSVHVQGFQSVLEQVAHRLAPGLARLRTLFLSVSLSAAGDDPEDWAGLRACVAAFEEKTGWHPDRTEHVAGAFRFTRYDVLRGWAMRWIAAQKGQAIDPHADREYTDWAALARLMQDWRDPPRRVD